MEKNTIIFILIFSIICVIFAIVHVIFVFIGELFFNFARLQFYLIFGILLTYFSWERLEDTQSHKSYLKMLIPLIISAVVIALSLRYLSNVLDLW